MREGQLVGLEQGARRRRERERQHGRLFPGERGGYRRGHVLAQAHMMLEGAFRRIVDGLVLADGQADDAVADAEPGDAAADRRDLARHVPTEHQRVAQPGKDQAAN